MTRLNKTRRFPYAALGYLALINALAFLALADSVKARSLAEIKQTILAPAPGSALLPSDRDLASDLKSIPEESSYRSDQGLQTEVDEMAAKHEFYSMRRKFQR